MSADHPSTANPCGLSPTPASVACDAAGARPGVRPRRLGPVRRRLLTTALVLVLVLLVPGVSYVQALTYPGSATWQMRSVEWLRDHGASPLVDRAENWYYTANRPTGPAPAGLPMITPGRPLPAPPPATVGRSRASQGGSWVPGRLDSRGTAAIYTTLFRPDAQYPSVVAAVAWIRAGSTSAHLVAGTRVAVRQNLALIVDRSQPVMVGQSRPPCLLTDEPHRDHCALSACPPNSLRIPDRTRLEKSASPRELNRAKRAADSTGVGTPSSTAA